MTNSGALVLTGMSWSDGSPRLRVRQPPDADSTLVPVSGFRLNYQLGADPVRACVGHKPFRDGGVPWFDCDNEPLHDGRKCDRCAAVDATFASQLHHAHNKARGELEGSVLRHLEQANCLYLACFRDGSIKVGTSTAPRLQVRLAEQGAWLARVLANTTDGFAVRSLEDRVTVELGIPQSVSMRRKLAGLVQPTPDESLLAELDRWTSVVHGLIEDRSDDRVTRSSKDWQFELAANPLWSSLHPYPLKLASGSHDLEFVAASGRAVVLRRPESSDHFVVDIQQLFGLVITPGNHVPDELSVQDSLF